MGTEYISHSNKEDATVMRQTVSFHEAEQLLDNRSTVTYVAYRPTHLFFRDLSFQTHDPTQPTKNKNSRPTPNPTHGSTQPTDNSCPSDAHYNGPLEQVFRQ